jgi:peptidoglycan endopeptidase LytF
MKLNSAVNLRAARLLLLPLLLALTLAGLPGLGTAHAAGVGPNKQAVVVGAGGGTVRYREGAGQGYAVKGSLVEGDKVWVLEGPVNGWYRISIGSTIGWISGAYLAGVSGSAATPSKPAATKPATIAGGTPAVIQNAGGGNVRYRVGAGLGYDVKGSVAGGDKVTVLEGPVDGWYRIKVGSTIGWISGSYLGAAAGTASKPAATTSKPATKSAPVLKGYAKIANSNGDAVRVRSTPGGKVIATAGPGTVLAVKKGPTIDKSGAAWYQVAGANITGWVTAGYLASAPAPKAAAQTPAKKAVAKAASPTPQPAARTGTARGATRPPTTSRVGSGTPDVVAVAMKYVGYSYRYGGTTPSGFDCSGFVYYVFNKAGIAMGRSMDAELGSGAHISSGDLQPGDLVYFANTYRSGISHISIYIGNGKIVHAADYNTGVEVSDLWSPYWAAHYAGAVRVSR